MKSNQAARLRDYLQLSKLAIMLPVSLTGFTGYFIFRPQLSVKLIIISLGILLLAVSASALNQIQEAGLDSRMERTGNRPVPSGRISKKNAAIFTLITFIAGFSLLFLWGNSAAALTGLFTIFWYNVIYTGLKRITAFAVVPGALTGALPPLIGWLAAGGGIFDKPVIYLEFLIFTGQIPHFWLLLLKYGEEYEKAGIPSMTKIFRIEQINRLTFMWVLTSVIAALFLCYFEVIRSSVIILILLTASILILLKFFPLLKGGADKTTSKKYSLLLDSYFLMVLLLLISDRLIQ